MKKVLSLLLVVVLALGMSSVAFAATAKVTGFSSTPFSFLSGPSTPTRNGNNYDFGTVNAGDKYYFDVDTSVFTWGTGTVPTSTSASTLSTVKFTVKTKTNKGGNTIDEIKLDGSKGLKIEFVEPFKTNDSDGQDFDIDIIPAYSGTKDTSAQINITGTLYNGYDEIDPDDDNDEWDFDNGSILKPLGFIRGVDLIISDNNNDDTTVIINANLYKNKKVWIYIDQEPNDADLVYYDAYKGIVESMRIYQKGLNTGVNYVQFPDVEAGLYVYTASAVDADAAIGTEGDALYAENASLTYIGKTAANAQFPLYENYYFASKQLDIDEIEDEPEEDDEGDDWDDVPEAPPITGGDDGYPSTVNDNPGTGR